MLEKEDLQAIAQLIKGSEDRMIRNTDEKLAAMDQRIGAIDGKLSDMNGQLTLVRINSSNTDLRLSNVEITLENRTNRAIDTLVEGQELTHQRIAELAGKDELQSLREDMALLRLAVAAHSREIEALKKAQ